MYILLLYVAHTSEGTIPFPALEYMFRTSKELLYLGTSYTHMFSSS